MRRVTRGCRAHVLPPYWDCGAGEVASAFPPPPRWLPHALRTAPNRAHPGNPTRRKTRVPLQKRVSARDDLRTSRGIQTGAAGESQQRSLSRHGRTAYDPPADVSPPTPLQLTVTTRHKRSPLLPSDRPRVSTVRGRRVCHATRTFISVRPAASEPRLS